MLEYELKLIFLDFDGVLNSDQYIRNCGYEGLVIDQSKMILLKEIVEQTDAKVVLTTSWRRYWEVIGEQKSEIGKQIKEMFDKYKIKIFRKTRELSTGREDEIKAILDEINISCSFVVIDDAILDTTGFLKDRVVKTSRYVGGLTKEDAQKAIDILNGGKKLPKSDIEFSEELQNNCVLEKDGKCFNYTIKHFFGKGIPLKLTFYKMFGIIHMHDNGCALELLKKRLGDSFSQDIAYKICSEESFDEQNRLVGNCRRHYFFHYYIQALIMLANGDLIHKSVSEQFYNYYHLDLKHYKTAKFTEFKIDELLDFFKEVFKVRKQTNKLVVYGEGGRYSSVGSANFAHCFVPLNKEEFEICDYRGQTEGELLESFYWTDARYIDEFKPFIQPILDRFNGDVYYNKVYVARKQNGGMTQALLDFYNIAVLLSELNHTIDLPKKAQS